MLLSTIVGGQTLTYALPTATATTNPEMVQINANGNVVAELVAAIRDENGSLIFGNLSGVLNTGFAVGNGAVPVTERGVGSANPQPYFNPDTGFNVNALNQINLQGISSKSNGVTYAFNVFNLQPNSNVTLNYPLPSGNTSVSNNTLWDIQLLQINNGTGKATFIADLTNQLETGGLSPIVGLGPTFLKPTGDNIPQGSAAFLPDLLNATNVTIGGAAFNPADNRLYFDVTFKPPSNVSLPNFGDTANIPNGVGGNVTVNILMSIDPTAGNENAVISTMTYGNGIALNNGNATLVQAAEGNSRLDDNFGSENITGLTFTPITPTTSTMWTYRIPTTVNTTTGPNLEQYSFPLATNPVTGFTIVNPNTFSNVTEQGAALEGITGLTFIPQDSGVTSAQNGFFLWATGDGSLHRIDVGKLTGGDFLSANWGTTQDLNTAPGFAGGAEGLDLQGLTWNPAVIDPFTETQGVLMSYDNGTKDVVFISDALRGSGGFNELFAVYTNQADINSSLTFQTFHVTPTNPFVSDLYANNFLAGFGGEAAWSPQKANKNNHVPGNVGQALLGYFDGTSTAPDTLIQSGNFVGPLGILPGQYTTALGGTPSTILQPGLYVGYGLETPAATSGSISGDTLGNDFVSVSASSPSAAAA